MYRRYTADDIAVMRQMADAGRTNAEIAKALGRSPDAVHMKRIREDIHINRGARYDRAEAAGAPNEAAGR